MELDPKNLSVFNNKAVTYFDEGNYDRCIAICENALMVGREIGADYALMAKFCVMIGMCKKNQTNEELMWYNRAISYYKDILKGAQDPEIFKKHSELEVMVKKLEEKATYERNAGNLGNKLLKKEDYPGAMKHYSVAIERNPKCAVLYSNRAACYIKLNEFQQAVDDCSTCLEIDPTCVKAYIQKGVAFAAMYNYTSAWDAYNEALNEDPFNEEAKAGKHKCDTAYYSLLQAEPSASRQEIVQAFKRLSLILHPDKSKGNETYFKAVSNAKTILLDDVKRKQYDLYGLKGLKGLTASNSNAEEQQKEKEFWKNQKRRHGEEISSSSSDSSSLSSSSSSSDTDSEWYNNYPRQKRAKERGAKKERKKEKTRVKEVKRKKREEEELKKKEEEEHHLPH